MRTLTNLFILMFSTISLWAAPPLDISPPNTALFISTYAEVAQSEMRKNDIPASIKLGQAALESGWGQSELARYSNNLFGLKCWNENDCPSKTYEMKDDDYDDDGNLIPSTFMAFDHPTESFYMHTDFLKKSMNRYGHLFDLPKGDYKSWAYGLKKAGYATAPDYAEKLIQLIETYELYKYDEQVINNNYQQISREEALNDLAAVATPSNPVKELQISEADSNGSFGSHSVANYTPASATTNFPLAPENPKIHDNTAQASITEMPIIYTSNQTPENIFEQSFGSEDISNYVPAIYKDLLEDTEKGGESQLEKLDKLPSKKMLGGSSKPR